MNQKFNDRASDNQTNQEPQGSIMPEHLGIEPQIEYNLKPINIGLGEQFSPEFWLISPLQYLAQKTQKNRPAVQRAYALASELKTSLNN